MISLAAFSDQFGATVGFDDTLQAITITLGDRTVSMIPYSNTALLNGNVVELSCPMEVIDDITYLPLQFMCDTFNLNCTWGDANQQVVIFNVCTRQPITCYLDAAWGCRRHVWGWGYYRRNYDKYSHLVYGQPPVCGQTPGCGQPSGYRQGPGYGQTTGNGQPQWHVQPQWHGQHGGQYQPTRGHQAVRHENR